MNTTEIQPTEKSISIWFRALRVSLRSKSNYRARLLELQTWDTCNGHEYERLAKIEALKLLINNN